MKKKLSKNNPYKRVRAAKFHGAKAYLAEVFLEKRSTNHLDFGAYDGEFVSSLKAAGLISKGTGLDANREMVEGHKAVMPAGIELKCIKPNSPIPFHANTFNSISLIGVLEHVVEQEKLLRDLHRVLLPGGTILVAVPGKHFFSFLDMGNWKFIFPKLHEALVVATKGREFFKRRYSENPNGLYGDVEKDKFWHEHFSKQELELILKECGFSVEDLDGFGFFTRILTNFAHFSPKFLLYFINPLIAIDARVFASSEIWILARKET